MIEQTPQDTYDAAMDSVNLINAGNVSNMPEDEWADTVARNKEHLAIQVEKGADYFGTLDLTPFTAAIAKVV
jgi:hypothetical protein